MSNLHLAEQSEPTRLYRPARKSHLDNLRPVRGFFWATLFCSPGWILAGLLILKGCK